MGSATKIFRRNNDPPRRPSLPNSTGSTTSPASTRRPSLPFFPRRGGRKRALTPPFPDNTSSSARQPTLLEQDHSMFLYSLPYELRELVYLMVLGEGPIRVEEVDDRTGMRKKVGKKEERGKVQLGIVSLMQSCRQAYIELHPLLYQIHAVHLPSLAAFRNLTTNILPACHLPLLTSLHLTIYFPYLLFPMRTVPPPDSYMARTIKPLQHFDQPLWSWTWEVLGDLCQHGALQELRFDCRARDYTSMHGTWPKRPEESVARALWSPILKVGRGEDGAEAALEGLRVWEFEVSWPVGDEGEGGPQWVERDEWPFVLTSVGSSGEPDEERTDARDGPGGANGVVMQPANTPMFDPRANAFRGSVHGIRGF